MEIKYTKGQDIKDFVSSLIDRSFSEIAKVEELKSGDMSPYEDARLCKIMQDLEELIKGYVRYNSTNYLTTSNLKTTDWKPYEEFGSYYRLLNGVLVLRPMLKNGEMESEDCMSEVDYVEEQDKARIEEIKKELLEEERNWIKEAVDYADFLNLERPEIKTTKQAKEYLYEMLDFMLSTNGEGEMYEWELNMAKELGIKINN